MMKKIFSKPEITVTEFMEENVITSSGGLNGAKLDSGSTSGYTTASMSFNDFESAVDFTW